MLEEKRGRCTWRVLRGTAEIARGFKSARAHHVQELFSIRLSLSPC